MKSLVSFSVLVATLAVGLCLADDQVGSPLSSPALAQQINNKQQQQPQQQPHPQPQAAASAPAPASISANQADGRQGRSIASNGATGNNLSGGSSNIIEHSSIKSRLEAEKRQVQEFLTTKNIFKSIVKLLFGNQEEISATSRNVLGVLSKVLDLLRNTFLQKARNGSGGRTIKDSAGDAAHAGVSMLQGYVKSLLANDSTCAKRHLCDASRLAVREGRDLGYVIASVGGYTTSYLLDSTKSGKFAGYHEASHKGRSLSQTDPEVCAKDYVCTEQPM